MQAEFATLTDNGVALDWAMGCLGSALGWRVRKEALFLVLFVLAPPLLAWASATMSDALHPVSPAWVKYDRLFQSGSVFLATLVLALLKPRLAILSALVIAYVGPDGLISWFDPTAGGHVWDHFEGSLVGFITPLWTDADGAAANPGHLHNWQVTLIVIWRRFEPCLCGAALGWAAAWLAGRPRVRRVKAA